MAKRCAFLVVLWLAAAFLAPPATSQHFLEEPQDVLEENPDPPKPEEPEEPDEPTTEATTTAAPDSSSTTDNPDNSSSSPTVTESGTPPTPENPCASNPCGDGSTCEERAGENFVCLCLPGEAYNNEANTCNKAKVFPGTMSLPDVTYVDKLKDKTSKEFQDASNYITEGIADIKDETFVGSRVLEFRPASSSTRATEKPKAEASVEIIFEASSPITQAEVETLIKEKVTCDKCPLEGLEFNAKDLCASESCDKGSTTCTPATGSFSCSCIKGYIKTSFSDRICLACPSGKKAQDSVECVNCPFGYSGFNCEENWKLVLVIVGSVLGGLLLITLIILPVVALKSPKKSSKKSKKEDIGQPYVSHSPAKAPLVNSSFVSRPAASINGSAGGPAGNIGVPRIPRATSNNNNWDSRNNLEMTPSNSRQNLMPGRNTRLNDDPDDAYPYSQSRPQSNPYAQSRPQSNPYAQSRAHVNPYAERQGHSNPYYTHDDGRRF